MKISIKLQVIAFIILSVVNLSNTMTLSEIYRQLNHVHKDSVLTMSQAHPDYHRTKHREIIGSFRGEPIYNRQFSGFVDDNGVPVPVLPYAKTAESGDNGDSWRRG